MTWMRGLGYTKQSGHKSGLHTGETRGFVRWTKRSTAAAGEAVGFVCETHLLRVSAGED